MKHKKAQDYESLYHLMNQRKGVEFIKLQRAVELLLNFYVALAKRDRRFPENEISWGRLYCSNALVQLEELMEFFQDGDVLVSSCAEQQGEPYLRIIHNNRLQNIK